MAITFEVRQKKVQAFAKELEKMGIPFSFAGPNEMKIYLSNEKTHCLDVDFYKQDEFYTLKGRHNMTKEEIHNLNRLLLMINEHFADVELPKKEKNTT